MKCIPFTTIEKTLEDVLNKTKDYLRRDEIQKLMARIKKTRFPPLPQKTKESFLEKVKQELGDEFAKRLNVCPNCGGDGSLLCLNDNNELLLDENGELMTEECKHCFGYGLVIQFRWPISNPCPRCYGKGHLILRGNRNNPFDRHNYNDFYFMKCSLCGGTGTSK